MDEKKKMRRDDGSLFIPAGMFLGLGWGFLVGNIPAGIMLGFGVGFLLYAIARVFFGK